MSGNTTSNTQSLIRSELWAEQLEEILHEQLLGTPYVRQIDFPDGSAFTMPSLGTALVRDLPETADITFDPLDTGEVTITMNDPVQAANSVKKVLMEDSMWAADLMAAIAPLQAQAIMERFETDVLSLANQQFNGTGDANAINGFDHRLIGTGTNETMSPRDFSYAKLALTKAKIPTTGLIAIVDPTVAHTIETSTNLVNVSNNPRWEGIIESGIEQNMRFVKNIYGFDVFESNLLADANETIGSLTTTAGKANIFMSAANERLLPFVLAWRRRPMLETDSPLVKQEEQIVTTARWGTGLVRDENLVVVLTDTDV
jgi:hypothetical protein